MGFIDNPPIKYLGGCNIEMPIDTITLAYDKIGMLKFIIEVQIFP